MKHIYPIKSLFIILVLFTAPTLLRSQESANKDFLRDFKNADMYYYYDENYLKAASLYEPLVKAYPDNYNLAAKLGICYLNLDGKKVEALNLLEESVRRHCIQGKGV